MSDTPCMRYRLELLEEQLRQRAEIARTVAGRLHMESPGAEPRLVVGMTMAHHAVYLECADMIRALLA